jgi:hypothetical protein
MPNPWSVIHLRLVLAAEWVSGPVPGRRFATIHSLSDYLTKIEQCDLKVSAGLCAIRLPIAVRAWESVSPRPAVNSAGRISGD